MISARELKITGEERLRRSGVVDSHLLDAELLLLRVLKMDRVELILALDQPVGERELSDYLALIERRAAGEPVAYIVGEREFYGYPFKVNRSVLIPRPETELIVDLVLSRATSRDEPLTLIDIGVGSGAILLSCLKEIDRRKVRQVTGIGVDISIEALQVAQQNARNLAVPNVTLINGDLISALSPAVEMGELIIVSNPPYIAADEELPVGVKDYEPPLALWGGEQGLELIERLISEVTCWIERGAYFLMEIGAGQGNQIISALTQRGLIARLHRDLAGRDRVIEVVRNNSDSN